MSPWQWLLLVAAATFVAYGAFIAWLLLAGRREEARALVGFIPDCVVLFRRLLADERIPRRRKLVLLALVAYLAMPFDLVPDFIPVAGQLDDAIVVAAVLRSVLRAGGPDLLRQHWPGPPASLSALMRLSYGRAALEAANPVPTHAVSVDVDRAGGDGRDLGRGSPGRE